MSKRKRESSSPVDSLFLNAQSTPLTHNPHKLNLSHNSFNFHPGKITKSFSTNTISFNNNHGISRSSSNIEMDVDVPLWRPKPPKHNTPFSTNKQVHNSVSSSSIESSLSLLQHSTTSSVESLSLSLNYMPNEMSTPNNSFKFVKPLQTAFNSSGILSKKNNCRGQNVLQSPMVFNQNGILIEKKSSLAFPDTPCKSANASSFDYSLSASNDSNLLGYLKEQLVSYWLNSSLPKIKIGLLKIRIMEMIMMGCSI